MLFKSRVVQQALRGVATTTVIGALLVPALAWATVLTNSGTASTPLLAAHQAAYAWRITRAQKVLSPTRGAYTGVYRPPHDAAALEAYRQLAGKSAAIVAWYQPWGSYGEFRADAIKEILRRGSVPMITWEPWDPGSVPHQLGNPAEDPDWALSKILSGTYDSYIRTWARAAKAVRGPIMIRLAHEMDGNWYPWGGTVNGNTPAQYRAMWRHVHDIFTQEGATNVTWVWCVNCNSVPNTYANRFGAYYPGSAYVDWVAVDGFNWGLTTSWSRNQSFESIYSAPLSYLKSLGKPVMIGEIATVSRGVNKPAWITASYNRIRVYHPEIKAVVYYDFAESGVNGTQDWQFESSAASVAAFRAALKYSWFVGGAARTLLPASTLSH